MEIINIAHDDGHHVVRLTIDDMHLVEAALAHAMAISHDMLHGMGFSHELVIARMIDDWVTEWTLRIQKAVPVPYHLGKEMVQRLQPGISLILDPHDGRYYLLCKRRYLDQLGIIMHMGQEWADTASCMVHVATTIAFEKTGSPFLSHGDIDNPEVEAGVARIAARFTGMREVLL